MLKVACPNCMNGESRLDCHFCEGEGTVDYRLDEEWVD